LVFFGLRKKSITGFGPTEFADGMRGDSMLDALSHEMVALIHSRSAAVFISYVGCPDAILVWDQPGKFPSCGGRHQRRDGSCRFG